MIHSVVNIVSGSPLDPVFQSLDVKAPFRLEESSTKAKLQFARFGTAYRVEVKTVSEVNISSFFSASATIITSMYKKWSENTFQVVVISY